jgi:hypothetical protein
MDVAEIFPSPRYFSTKNRKSPPKISQKKRRTRSRFVKALLVFEVVRNNGLAGAQSVATRRRQIRPHTCHTDYHDLGHGGFHRDEKREIGANGRRWSRQFTTQLPGKRVDHPHAEPFACHRVKRIGKSDAFISD